MSKKILAVVLGTASVLSLNLPAKADDTAYPIAVQNYLNQLAVESDWIRDERTGKHYHFIAYIPTQDLVNLSNKICLNFTLGTTLSLLKPIIQADSLSILPTTVNNVLGTNGITRFSDVAIKSAVNNICPQFNNSLPLLNYILPDN